jgi:hypothetical protein
MITLSITPYDSREDVNRSLHSVERWWRQTSQTLKARPTKIWDHRRLQQSIVEAVQDNTNRPKAQQQTRAALMQALWQETRARGWHELSLAGFRRFFFDTLRVHGLTKKYMRL